LRGVEDELQAAFRSLHDFAVLSIVATEESFMSDEKVAKAGEKAKHRYSKLFERTGGIFKSLSSQSDDASAIEQRIRLLQEDTRYLRSKIREEYIGGVRNQQHQYAFWHASQHRYIAAYRRVQERRAHVNNTTANKARKLFRKKFINEGLDTLINRLREEEQLRDGYWEGYTTARKATDDRIRMLKALEEASIAMDTAMCETMVTKNQAIDSLKVVRRALDDISGIQQGLNAGAVEAGQLACLRQLFRLVQAKGKFVDGYDQVRTVKAIIYQLLRNRRRSSKASAA